VRVWGVLRVLGCGEGVRNGSSYLFGAGLEISVFVEGEG
jgi:hypothetical protein